MNVEERKREWAWSNEPIVLPLAYQEREWNAAYIAFYLSEYSGSTVHTVHVHTQPEGPEAQSFISRLNDLASELKINIIPHEKALEREVARGEVAGEIVKVANEAKAQAIVMAAHKESFFTELFGRVSDRVARTASCRVILVENMDPAKEVPSKPSKILVPVITRELDPEPLIVAAALTSTSTMPGAQIIVGRFVELPPTTPLDALQSLDVLREFEREFSERIGDAMNRVGRVFNPVILPVREYASDIRTYTEENNIEITILGGGERPSRLQALLRPEESAVVRSSPCPIVVVFPPLSSPL